MRMKLRAVEFSSEYLPRVQDFECGSEQWCRFAERWIKSPPPFPGALRSIQKYGNAVWLYFLDSPYDGEFLVGFSALGKSRWKIPPPDGPIREVGFIPMLAVALCFQGMPDGCPAGNRYIDEVMEHVIQQARGRRYREVALFVHKDNARAIALYERHGFQTLRGSDAKGNLKMLRLLSA